MSPIKKISPRKRTIFVEDRRFFLEFPEILEAKQSFAISLDGKFYFLPLPNIDGANNICHGDSTFSRFWVTRFTFHGYAHHRKLAEYEFYEMWARNGFDSIKNELTPMPIRVAIPFIEDDPESHITDYDFKRDPALIAYFKNPTDEQKEYALKHNPKLILKFENPTPQQINIAVSRNPELIEHFETSDNQKIIALEKNPDLIQYIKNPTKKMKQLALKRPANIKYFTADEEMQLFAVENSLPDEYHYIFGLINNPTRKTIIAAAKKWPYETLRDLIHKQKIDRELIDIGMANDYTGRCIQFVKNPSVQNILESVEKNIKNLRHFPNLKKQLKLQIIKNNPDAMRSLYMPDAEMQRIAVTANHRLACFIDKPTKTVSEIYERKTRQHTRKIKRKKFRFKWR